MDMRSLMVLQSAVLAAAAASAAATWQIKNEVVDGMTPSSQLTNAVVRASDGDTIAFEASDAPYQLDGESFMNTETGTSGSTTVTGKTYVHLTGKKLHFVGDVSEKWSGKVVLRGNGYDRFLRSTGNGSTIRGITFENFASCDHPELKVNNDNIASVGLGGVILFNYNNDGNIVSNCVFRGNTARGGGALARVYAMDCFFTNNVSYWGGGGTFSSKMLNCDFIDNRSVGTDAGFGGATCWPSLIRGCAFVGNRSHGYAGALVGDVDMIVEDCLFGGNVSGADGGAMNLRRNSRISRCTFFGNNSGTHGGAIASGAQSGVNGGAGTVFSECVFSNNVAATYGGAASLGNPNGEAQVEFRNCEFTENSARSQYTGAFVVYGGTYSNCLFHGNFSTNGAIQCTLLNGTDSIALKLIDCVVSNNFCLKDGLVRNAYVTNTLFYCNEVPQAGSVIRGCHAVECRFVGNRKWDSRFGIVGDPGNMITPVANAPSGDATESRLVKCNLDLGCILNCSLVDCHVHTLTNKGAYCVFYGHNVATNCLIEDCRPPDQLRAIIYRWGPVSTYSVSGSDYVNCTFAGNRMPRLLNHQQEYGIATPFKNCVFYNNRNSGNKLIDMQYRIDDSKRGDMLALDSGIALSNCVFGATATDELGKGDTWHDLGGNKIVEPEKLLVADTKAAMLGVHKYALRPESPAIGMGDASMFAATDLDYAGNLRLRDGRLDPGCFECWLNIKGTLLVVK